MLEFTDEQRLIQSEIQKICADFDEEYWRSQDRKAEYPTEFAETLGENGWLGTVIPEEYGGAGMDTLEAAMVLEEISASGAGFRPRSDVHPPVHPELRLRRDEVGVPAETGAR
jgi:acyl-CoA dehydrogenase